MTFDERCEQDPQIGPVVLQGAQALAAHRMMRDGSPPWGGLLEVDRLTLLVEVSVVLRAVEPEA